MTEYFIHCRLDEKHSFQNTVEADSVSVESESVVLKIDGVIVAAFPSSKTTIIKKNLKIKSYY